MNMKMKLGIAAMAAIWGMNSALAAEFTMRFSHQLPPTHDLAKAIQQFANDVKANTKGQVEVQVFGAEQLFKATQNHAAVARGQVEAASILSLQWTSTIPEMGVMTIPFLMSHVNQIRKFPGSTVAKYLDDKIEQKGVKNIAWLFDANDVVFTSNNKPLVKPEDFKGVKIRGLNKLYDNGLVALGAAPSAMPGSEVYQALQTGVLDAGQTSADAVYSRRYYEVQKYGVATSAYSVYQTLVVNPKWWGSLPAAYQKGIQDAANKAELATQPKTDGVAPEQLAKLKEKGMSVTVLNPDQVNVLKNIMQPPVIKAFKDASPDAEKLINMVKGL